MQIRRKYQLVLKIWNKEQIFNFFQATAYETMEFMEDVKENDFSPIMWLFNFLNDKCITDKWLFSRKNINFKEFKKFAPDFERLFEIITDKYFFKSFIEEEKNETEESEEAEEKNESMPFDSYLVLLAWKISLDPLEILKKYTFEQISDLWKWLVYVLNMSSEEWRKKNQKMQVWEKIKKVWKEAIDEAIAKLTSYHHKK